jgi:hypothetical protein
MDARTIEKQIEKQNVSITIEKLSDDKSTPIKSDNYALVAKNQWDNFQNNPRTNKTNPFLKTGIKIHQELFKTGILTIARNDNHKAPIHGNGSSFSLGNRNFTVQAYKDCDIYWMTSNPAEDTPTLDNLLIDVDSLYIITNESLFFVTKNIQEKIEIHPIEIKQADNQTENTATYREKNKSNLFQTFKDKLLNHSKLYLKEKSDKNNLNSPYILLYKKPLPSDIALKLITSMTSHRLNENSAPSKQKALIEWVAKNSTSPIEFNTNYFIQTANRRDEIFFPLSLNYNKTEAGFFIYPWCSDKIEISQSQRFKTFITAGCMFGSYLVGSDYNLDSHKPLIKHDIKFTGDDEINGIQYLAENNPYEEIVFWEFEKLLYFIQATAIALEEKSPHKDEIINKVRLLYHLPSVDYMLFGIKIFLQGRMTLGALNELFDCINREKEHYLLRLNNILADLSLQDKIELDIRSPFDALLSQHNKSIGNSNHSQEEICEGDKLATSLLTKTLKLLDASEIIDHSSYKIKYSTTNKDERREACKKKEENLVRACRELLSNTSHMEKEDFNNPEKNYLIEHNVWLDLFNVYDASPKQALASGDKNIDTEESPIEDLLTIGNTMIHSLASYQTNITKSKPDTRLNDHITELNTKLTTKFNTEFDTELDTTRYTRFDLKSDAKPGSVCSVLPISEKQIQNSYQMCHKEMQKNPATKNKYLPIINFTYLDSVIAYGPNTSKNLSTLGQAYYFNYPEATELNNLYQQNLKQASANISACAKKTKIRQSPVTSMFRLFTPPSSPQAEASTLSKQENFPVQFSKKL